MLHAPLRPKHTPRRAPHKPRLAIVVGSSWQEKDTYISMGLFSSLSPLEWTDTFDLAVTPLLTPLLLQRSKITVFPVLELAKLFWKHITLQLPSCPPRRLPCLSSTLTPSLLTLLTRPTYVHLLVNNNPPI